jgi:hypothetical protein
MSHNPMASMASYRDCFTFFFTPWNLNLTAYYLKTQFLTQKIYPLQRPTS